MKKIVCLICVTFLMSCVILTGDRKSIDTNRIYLVDNIDDKVFLFRGPGPVLNGNYFDYDTLITTINQRLVEAGYDNITNPYIVDTSLLFIERIDLHVEKQFFDQNPNLGEFVNYPVFGALTTSKNHIYKRITQLIGNNANIANHSFIKNILDKIGNLGTIANKESKLNLEIDKNALTSIRQLVKQNYPSPTVVYVHCEAGCDRTGEIIAEYRMQYLDVALAKTLDLNNQECGREQQKTSIMGIQNYCYYLKANINSQIDCNTP